MKFIDMFAGIGGFRTGLENAGHECVGYIEWDKYARQSYEAIYDTKGEFTENDIQEAKGKELPDADIWTFGSPCTDISVAGKQAGLEKGRASSMFFEVIRLIEERIEYKKTQPKYLLMENVKNLLSSNGGWDFTRVLIEMDKVGYDVEWGVLNSSDVVPQNRERIYIVGHLRGASTKQVFPISRESKSTSKRIEKICNYGITNHHSNAVYSDKGISQTLTATDYKHPVNVGIRQVGNIGNKKLMGGNPQTGRIYSPDGLAPTLNTMQGGGREPKVLVQRPLKGKTTNGWHFEQECFSPESITGTLKAGGGTGNIPKIVVRPVLAPDRLKKRQNGRRLKKDGEPEFTLTNQDRHGVLIEKVLGSVQKHRAETDGTYSPTLTSAMGMGGGQIPMPVVRDGKELAIRKLTPLECWRLQGFSDEQFYKTKNSGVSNSQLYKQAGNAVTTKVVEQIGRKLANK